MGIAVFPARLCAFLSSHHLVFSPIHLAQRSRLEIIASSSPGFLNPVIDVYECVPRRGELGLLYETLIPDYPYFGVDFSRTLTQLVPQPDGQLLPDLTVHPELRYILAENIVTRYVPAAFTPIRFSNWCTLFVREDTTVNCEIDPHLADLYTPERATRNQ